MTGKWCGRWPRFAIGVALARCRGEVKRGRDSGETPAVAIVVEGVATTDDYFTRLAPSRLVSSVVSRSRLLSFSCTRPFNFSAFRICCYFLVSLYMHLLDPPRLVSGESARDLSSLARGLLGPWQNNKVGKILHNYLLVKKETKELIIIGN